MNRSEDSEVRQDSRIVTTARRQAMAREKARQSSALEQAAAEWEKEREARARKVEEERRSISRQLEACPLSFQQVSLSADSIKPPQEAVNWKPYNPEQEKGEKKGTATIVTRRVNMAGVCAFSRRLMAIERARALGRKPLDLEAWALEQAGRRWAEERARRKL